MVTENPNLDSDAANVAQAHGRRKLISKLLALAGLGVVGGLLSQEKTGIFPSVRANTASYFDTASPVLSVTNSAGADAIIGTGGRGVVGVATTNLGQGVTGFASNIGAIAVVAEGLPGQTANLQEWWIGANNPVSFVDATGNLHVGGANGGRVHVDESHANNGSSLTPGLVFAGNGSGEGITSNRNGVYDLAFWTNHLRRMTITNGGFVGIGTANPSVALDVAGEAHATDFVATSDMRFKEEVAPIDHALDKILRLQGVYFKWNHHYCDVLKRSNTKRRQVGVIAQQVREVLPEVVSKWGDEAGGGYLAVDCGRLVAVTIEAMKEQQRQIQQLSERIATLEGNRNRFASS